MSIGEYFSLKKCWAVRKGGQGLIIGTIRAFAGETEEIQEQR